MLRRPPTRMDLRVEDQEEYTALKAKQAAAAAAAAAAESAKSGEGAGGAVPMSDADDVSGEATVAERIGYSENK